MQFSYDNVYMFSINWDLSYYKSTFLFLYIYKYLYTQ